MDLIDSFSLQIFWKVQVDPVSVFEVQKIFIRLFVCQKMIHLRQSYHINPSFEIHHLDPNNYVPYLLCSEDALYPLSKL